MQQKGPDIHFTSKSIKGNPLIQKLRNCLAQNRFAFRLMLEFTDWRYLIKLNFSNILAK